MIVRDSYIADCSGVYVLTNDAPHKPGVIVNFTEGEIAKADVPSLAEGWRAIAVLLSPEDARSLGNALLQRVEELGG